jgi:hypothetical protein
MVPTITTILQRFPGEWAVLLEADAILTGCRESGYTAWRDRVLTPVTTIHLFLLQILHGNTACSHLPHLSGLRFSAAAYLFSPRVRWDGLLVKRSGCGSRKPVAPINREVGACVITPFAAHCDDAPHQLQSHSMIDLLHHFLYPQAMRMQSIQASIVALAPDACSWFILAKTWKTGGKP